MSVFKLTLCVLFNVVHL